MIFFYYESNFKLFFFGGGVGARVSDFFFTKNQNLKKNSFEGLRWGWGK